MFAVIAFLIFTAALGAAGYYAWSVPRQQEQQILIGRLRELRTASGTRAGGSGDLVRREQRGSFAPIGDFLAWVGGLRRLQDYIDQADLKYRAAEVFAFCVMLAMATFLLLMLFGLQVVVLHVAISLAIGALPVLYIRRARNRRLRKFEEGLPDAIDLFNRSMKAGHNIHAGLEALAEESYDPVKTEFRKVVEELALGAPVDQTLQDLGRRVPLTDLKFFITGLILQRQTGANMVQVLENLSLLIRERLNLAAKMKAATAQQRLSAALLCSLPAVVGFGFWLLKPEYVRLLFTDSFGQTALTYAVISEMVGILIIRKIANPRF